MTDIGGQHALGDDQYRQTDSGIWALVGGKWKPIAPFRLTVHKVTRLRAVGPDCRPGPQSDVLFDTEWELASGGQTSRVTISGRDMAAREPSWPHDAGIIEHTKAGWLKRITESVKAYAATAIATGAAATSAFDSLGPIYRNDGTLAFLTPGGPALTADGTDPAYTANLPSEVAAHMTSSLPGYGATDAATLAADVAALTRVFDVTPGAPAVGATLLGQLARSPLSSLPEFGPTLAVLYGPTGSMKTAVAGLLLQAQSRSASGRRVVPTVNLREQLSTPFAIDLVTHSLGGTVALLDDGLSGRIGPRDVAKLYRLLSTLGSHAEQRQGAARGRWGRDGGALSQTWYPRASLLVTTEAMPDQDIQASTAARWPVLELPSRAAVDLPALSAAQTPDAARATNRAMSAYVRWLLGNLDAAREADKWAATVTEYWDGHARAVNMYARLLAGCRLFERFAASVGTPRAGLADNACTALRAAADAQAVRMGIVGGLPMALDPVAAFRESYRALLREGRRHLSSVDRGGLNRDAPDRPGMPAGYTAADVGWRYGNGDWQPGGPEDGGVRRRSETGSRAAFDLAAVVPARQWKALCRAVTDRAVDDGVLLPNERELAERLRKADRLAGTSGVDLWGKQTKAYRLDLGWVLDADDDDPDDGRGQPLAEPDDDDGGSAARERAAIAAITAGGLTDSGTASNPAPNGPAALTCDVCGRRAVLSDAAGPWHPACRDEVIASAPVPTDTQIHAATGTQTDAATGTQTDAATEAPTHAATDTPAHTATPADSAADPRVGVLAADGLHLPGRPGPVPVSMPSHVGEAFDLAYRHVLDQLWVHPNVHDTLGLPVGDLDRPPTEPVAHPWMPAADIDALHVWPAGLAPRVKGYRKGESSVQLALPAFETRWDWRDATDGAGLLAALLAFAEAVGVLPGWSPNATGRALVESTQPRAHRGKGAPLRKLPPLTARGRLPDITGEGVNPMWTRDPGADELRAAAYVHAYDANGMFLAPCNAQLGVGNPEHAPDGREFDPALPGYWRVTIPSPGQGAAGYGADPLLPDLLDPQGGGARDGQTSRWLTTPTVAMATKLGVPLAVAEAWTWPQSARVLAGFYERLRDARAALAADDSRAGRLALAAVKIIYASTVGYLGSTFGDNRPPDDPLWRPDWRLHIMAEARARMHRRIVNVAAESGRRPIALDVDCLYYASSDADPIAACPAGLPLGPGLGEFKPAGTMTLTDLAGALAEIDTAERLRGLHDAFASALAGTVA